MKQRVFGCVLIGITLAAVPTRADTEVADKATGAVYVLTSRDDGTVVLASRADGEMDSYVLQPNCYAEHPIYGLGAWQAVEGGWRIMVQGTQIVSFDGAPPLDNPACVPQ